MRACPGIYVGLKDQCCPFIEGVLWIARNGSQWWLLSEKYGNWNSVYKRFARWTDKGIWHKLHQYFADDPDTARFVADYDVPAVVMHNRSRPNDAVQEDQLGGRYVGTVRVHNVRFMVRVAR